MKVQEASKDFTEREIMFPGPKTSYMEASVQKDGKTDIYASKHTHRRREHVHAPRACPCA